MRARAMKVYISVDIEGVAGITHWDEATIGQPGYETFRAQMTDGSAATCEGALAAGATDLLVKDAHSSGRNILPERLPEEARIIRAWSGNPLSMVEGVDEGFAAIAMVGYHSGPTRSRARSGVFWSTGRLCRSSCCTVWRRPSSACRRSSSRATAFCVRTRERPAPASIR
ncbi:MAG: hypothetical protein CMM46_15680 [Rhodospirillaceae bacterium]|nr:hypothetical protein [Rhodospirillaceae bacterium]